MNMNKFKIQKNQLFKEYLSENFKLLNIVIIFQEIDRNLTPTYFNNKNYQ